MRYLRLFLLCLGLMASLTWVGAQDEALAPDGIDGEVYYAPFDVAITLDGQSDDWAGVPRVFLSQNNHAVSFAAAADDSYLYLLADVTDPNIISGEHDSSYWNEDSLEFYINTTGEFDRRSYNAGVIQMTFPALNKDLPSEEAIIAGVQGTTANAQVVTVETDNGYRVEVAFPLEHESWTITPEHGLALGFQVHVNGANTANRDTKIIWSNKDVSDQSYQNPSVFGYLIFYETGQNDLPAAPEMVAAASSEPPVPDTALYKADVATEARIIDLLARMTLDEKIAQMTLIEKNSIQAEDVTLYGIGGLLSGGGGSPLVNTAEAWAEMVDTFQAAALESRLGIPMIYGVDAVHGHNNLQNATVFPHNIGLGATRNAALVAEICHITAVEMIATGIYWNYTPVVAVLQDIRWGRSYESYGENTDLVTELAIACIEGSQGESLEDPLSVLATPKHFVGDGGTTWESSTTDDYKIDQGVTDVDEATLRAVHLPPYIAAIEAGAQNIMISFSSWGGLKMHAQDYLINDVLKGELAFPGFIVSDWAGVDQISPDYYDSIVISVNAGVDMVMVPYDGLRFMDLLKDAVTKGDVSIERIDDAVTRILRVKFDMGLFERPFSQPELLERVGSDEHRALARQAVAESQVLLKNDGDVLPLSPEIDTLFVAGSAADNIAIQAGGWTIGWQGVEDPTTGLLGSTTILEGIQQAVSETTEVVYNQNGEFTERAAVGIVFVGELPYAEGLGDDGNLTLTASDQRIIETMRASVDQLIVVIVSGRPLMITEQIENWDAVVAAWLPGSEGAGVADVLFGAQPFTGKLSVSWPRSVEQLPLDNLLSDADGPLFLYGHGLTTAP